MYMVRDGVHMAKDGVPSGGGLRIHGARGVGEAFDEGWILAVRAVCAVCGVVPVLQVGGITCGYVVSRRMCGIWDG